MTSNIIEQQKELQQELQLITKWEKEAGDLWFWEKIARIPFVLLDKITPKIVHNLLGKVLDELGGYIQTGGKYLVSESHILKKYIERGSFSKSEASLRAIGALPMPVLNEVAHSTKEIYVSTATVQGATTGFGGIFTLAIDIPLLLGMSLKVLQEMAMCYGYDPHDKQERIFIVKCLQFASSDYVGKQSILQQLSNHSSELEEERKSISQLEGWREVIYNYRDNYGWKKLFQVVPVIGIVFGAYINRSTIQDVAEAGLMLYRKRRVLEKLKLLENNITKNLDPV